MVETEIVDELTVFFAQAGKAHREVFVDAGGTDPEWPLWYAEFLVERINTALDTSMTKSELCYLLVSADRERQTVAPGSEWHCYFARFFADRYV